MDSILIRKNFDRIYKINWMLFFRLSGRKPENQIASGEKIILKIL